MNRQIYKVTSEFQITVPHEVHTPAWCGPNTDITWALDNEGCTLYSRKDCNGDLDAPLNLNGPLPLVTGKNANEAIL